MRAPHTLAVTALCIALVGMFGCGDDAAADDATSGTNNASTNGQTSSNNASTGTNNGGTNTNNASTTSANNAQTGTNNATTATNNATTSTNNGTTSTNNSTTSTNSGTTSTNNATTSTNNSTTSTNSSTTSTNNGTTPPDPLACTEGDSGWTGTVASDAIGDEPAPLTGIMEAHNAMRRFVGVPDLTWSDSLAASAQTWADGLTTDGCSLQHDRGAFGENLWFAWSSGTLNLNPARVVGDWSCEREDWDNANATCGGQPGYRGADGEVCGHYTQVVWRESAELGCGASPCTLNGSGSGWVVVCRYTPPGNVNRRAPY